MRFDIMTLFPEAVSPMLNASILGRAQKKGLIEIHAHQIRDYTANRQNQVDDYPCGPAFDQAKARQLEASYDNLILVCGHYEGVDQRFLDECVDEEISMGDFVLTGGEIPALAIVDAVSRLIPGVLGDEICFTDESHWNGLLEYPQYSRPDEWHGLSVPEVLRSGDHAKVARWQKKQAILRTLHRRPDLFYKLLFRSRIKRGPSVNLSQNWRRRTMRSEIETLKTWITESDNIVFFGGAGVSTESGIPDFRSTDGLYHQKFDYPPETILSHTFFYQNPEYFFRFYREKMLPLDYQPNEAHKKLAALEQAGKLRAIVTQNIDGLHQKAGSKNVFELHGSIYRNYCEKCGKFYPPEYIRDSDGIPRCTCGGRIKPDVVLYEESLDQKVIEGAVRAIADADMLIVGGTSLTVYPAAGLIRYYRGNKLVLINRDETPYDGYANLIFRDPIGKVLGAV